MDRFEFQLAMLQKGAEELEKKIANFSTILQQVKTAAVTIWVALLGWVFASKIDALVPLGYVIIFCFWFLEATYWRVQFYYMQRASAVTEFLNDERALDESFSTRSLTGDNAAETLMGKALRLLNLQKDISDYSSAY
jgi:hypothetical protein